MPPPPASASDAAALLGRNPLLQEIGRVAPDRLPWFLAQLDAIRRKPRMRGGTPPGGEPPLTPEERAALDANPDLADAARVSPDPMARILRMMLDLTQRQVIGLIGGMGWESSAEYPRLIDQAARARPGGAPSARVLTRFFGSDEVEALQRAGRWNDAAALVADAARRLKRDGADFFLLCNSAMHRMAEGVQAAVRIPLLHSADATAKRVKAEGHRRVGLLGTAPTMEQAFYKGRLRDRHGLDVLVPDDDRERAEVHRVICDELMQGRVEPKSRDAYRRAVARLAGRGAEAVILGCTEITLLVGREDSSVPLFDATTIHAEAAVDRALAGRERAAS